MGLPCAVEPNEVKERQLHPPQECFSFARAVEKMGAAQADPQKYYWPISVFLVTVDDGVAIWGGSNVERCSYHQQNGDPAGC
jgi:hypothetical protein